MVIGRKSEVEKLQEAAKSEYSKFIAVYGRRRVGKTYLIRQSFKKFTFQFSGFYNYTKQQQLQAFYDALVRQNLKNTSKPPKNWYEAFELLKNLIEESEDKKKIIFIDELSWMDTQKSDLMSSLEGFWNGWASVRNDIVLIVCASATSWILDKVIHNKGGLYNRLSYEIALQPFTLAECKEFIKSKHISLSDYQIIECYMIMGGIPYYWDFLEKGLSLQQNIDKIFFAPDAPLRNEFDYLYQALFKNPEVYLKIISALGKKKIGMTRDELIKKTALVNSGDITKKLKELESCGFIRKYKAYGMKSRETVYQLLDNFTLFYYKFIEDNPDDPNFWEHTATSPVRNAWCGLAFERVCLQHIPQIKRKLGISGVLTNVNSWSCKEDLNNGVFGSQIDLLIVRKDQVINLCEMKYSAQEFVVTKEVDMNIRHKISDFYTLTKTKYSLHTTFVTPYGLVQNEYAGDVQSVVTAEDLFVAE